MHVQTRRPVGNCSSYLDAYEGSFTRGLVFMANSRSNQSNKSVKAWQYWNLGTYSGVLVSWVRQRARGIDNRMKCCVVIYACTHVWLL